MSRVTQEGEARKLAVGSRNPAHAGERTVEPDPNSETAMNLLQILRRILWVTTGCGLTLTPMLAQEARPFDQSHAAWSEVLRACVRDGGFDYALLKKDRTQFDGYVLSLTRVTPQELAGWTREQRFAYWINAYNAFTVQRVIDSYPLKSIRKLDGAFGITSVFEKPFIPLQAHHPDGKNEELALNDLEHKILRVQFKDARLHAAINCASVSCPPLRNEAFVAERLDAQLEAQMKAFVNDPTRNTLDAAGKKLAVSEIFKWFEEDFERDAKSVKEYLVRFAPPATHDFIRGAKLQYLAYDWDLNDVPKK